MRFRLIDYSTTLLALSSTHLSSLPTFHGGLHTAHITYVQILNGEFYELTAIAAEIDK